MCYHCYYCFIAIPPSLQFLLFHMCYHCYYCYDAGVILLCTTTIVITKLPSPLPLLLPTPPTSKPGHWKDKRVLELGTVVSAFTVVSVFAVASVRIVIATLIVVFALTAVFALSVVSTLTVASAPIGAGTGLLSVLLATLGAHVTATVIMSLWCGTVVSQWCYSGVTVLLQ
jgi:hypothetical protein